MLLWWLLGPNDPLNMGKLKPRPGTGASNEAGPASALQLEPLSSDPQEREPPASKLDQIVSAISSTPLF